MPAESGAPLGGWPWWTCTCGSCHPLLVCAVWGSAQHSIPFTRRSSASARTFGRGYN